MSKVPVDLELRDELLVSSGNIIMRGTDTSIWCYSILPVLLEEASVGKGDPRIAGRHIAGVEDILPRNPTRYQKTIYYGFSYAIRAHLFPRYFHTQPTFRLGGVGIEKDKPDTTIIEYEGRKEHPSVTPDIVGPRYPVPESSGGENSHSPDRLPDEKRQSGLEDNTEKSENLSRFKHAVTLMAGNYLGGHPSPDGMAPDRSIRLRARACVAGEADRDMSYYHLFLALTYREALCKLADRYVVLVATAPGRVRCAHWDCVAAESLGDKYEWYNRLWKKIYTMELFPPPSPAGEQGSRWRKPARYLAAALIFAGNDEAEVDEKLDWLFAGALDSSWLLGHFFFGWDSGWSLYHADTFLSHFQLKSRRWTGYAATFSIGRIP